MSDLHFTSEFPTNHPIIGSQYNFKKFGHEMRRAQERHSSFSCATSGAERFSRIYFSPGFTSQMHSMHSDVSLFVWGVMTSRNREVSLTNVQYHYVQLHNHFRYETFSRKLQREEL